jgi:perosamine synthetase
MSKLALLGGEKTVKIDYETAGNLPCVNEKGLETAVDLMRKGQISTSPLVKEFEKRFAEYIGTEYGLCSNNGTSSLHEALFAAGVGPGDEVIVPSYTFWATAGPIVSAQGNPVFADVDKETYNLDPKAIEKNITSRTKAIMVVHVWGNPADMDAIMAIARKYNIAVIEDCSHAHGAMLNGKKVGSIGDLGCFSLQASKTMPGGEGGILTTNNREYFERAVALGHYERLADLPEDSDYRKYSLTGMGYKYRIHPIAVALASSAFDELDERNEIRNRNGKTLEKGLEGIDCIIPQKVLDGAVRQYSYHFATYDETKLDNIPLEVFLKALKEEGVACGFCGYGRLHKAPLFTERDNFRHVELPVTEYLATHTFMMAPRFEKECPELIDQYIEAYHKVVNNADELKEYAAKNEDLNAAANISGRSINLL